MCTHSTRFGTFTRFPLLLSHGSWMIDPVLDASDRADPHRTMFTPCTLRTRRPQWGPSRRPADRSARVGTTVHTRRTRATSCTLCRPSTRCARCGPSTLCKQCGMSTRSPMCALCPLTSAGGQCRSYATTRYRRFEHCTPCTHSTLCKPSAMWAPFTPCARTARGRARRWRSPQP